jgi:hypothetical protein
MFLLGRNLQSLVVYPQGQQASYSVSDLYALFFAHDSGRDPEAVKTSYF